MKQSTHLTSISANIPANIPALIRLFAPILQPFGVDLFCLGKKFLVYNMVSRNLKIKYRRSVVGILWTLISPISMGIVYYFVFKVVMSIRVPYYMAFILSGVLPWSFFNQTLIEGMESLVGNLGIVSKVPIPLQVFPYVGALTNLSTLLLSLPVLIGAALISGCPMGISVVLLPVIMVALFFITYFLGAFLSIFFVYFRDLRHIMGIVLQVWFYATPVLYNEEMIPVKYRWVLMVNPIAPFFTSMHKVLVNGAWPSQGEVAMMVFWCAVIYLGCVLFFKRFNRNVVENI